MSEHFCPEQIPPQDCIRDVFSPPIGPLGALISACKKYPKSAFFVLACDLPFFSSEAASFLIKHRNPSKKASVFEGAPGSLEPLCGIYEPHILPDLLQAYAQDRLCPRKILRQLDVQTIALPNALWTTNINTQAESTSIQNAMGTSTAHTPAIVAVKVTYFASLREAAKTQTEEVTTAATTVQSLYADLAVRHGLSLPSTLIRFAKNDQLVANDCTLQEGDHIVFMPPVSGG